MKNSWLIITYLIYIIIFEILIIGGCAYVVFWRHESGWWFVLACIVSSLAYSPKSWNRLFSKTNK
jgi:hypothetical protein